MYITIFAGRDAPFTVSLEDYGKDVITIGRGIRNDIIVNQHIVSVNHAFFIKKGEDWYIEDDNSTNGLMLNNEMIKSRLLSDGLKIYIGNEEHEERVLFICLSSWLDGMYQSYDISAADNVIIGRDMKCDICVNHISVSKEHALIYKKEDKYYLKCINNSLIRYNSAFNLTDEICFKDMDRFIIGDTQFLYRNNEIFYYSYKNGIGVEVSHVSKMVSSGKKAKYIVDDVSLRIEPGELTAIIGGSGAGKTSLMRCMNGSTSITSGSVLIRGEDISSEYNAIKHLIGYVPQQDIVYDNLTLNRMLYYAACLKMPAKTSREDIDERIKEIIDMVELKGHENTMIKRLSGGQKKRASIAVELLSDPDIMFLDEPTSGLDPGTEYKMMCMLKNMTNNGKTVILVTHATLNIGLCDRIIFMAPGGRLAYSGNPKKALDEFGVESIVDIYNLIQDDPDNYIKTNDDKKSAALSETDTHEKFTAKKVKTSAVKQTVTLIKRYCEMIANDKKRMAIILFMPLVLGFIMLAATWNDSLVPFKYAADTQTFSLAMACGCFFMGLFQSFQEISKERTIVEREKASDMKCLPYCISKFIVLAALLLLQCLILMVFSWNFILDAPEHGVLFENFPFLEFYITSYLTGLSAVSIGLAVSAWAKSSEQTLYVMPLLLMIQILFSEVVCSLSGIAMFISYFASSRWSCLAFCASARINELYVRPDNSFEVAAGVETELEEAFINARYDFMEGYSVFSPENPVMKGWLWLLALGLIFFVVALLFLKKKRER